MGWQPHRNPRNPNREAIPKKQESGSEAFLIPRKQHGTEFRMLHMLHMLHVLHVPHMSAGRLRPGRGEEKTLQGTMAQRLTSAELPRRTASRQTRKDCAKQQFYAVFVFFAVKGKGLQPWVVFDCNPWMLCNRRLCFVYNRWLCSAHSVKKEGMVKPSLLISTSVFAPANAVMCARVHPATQPPDAPRRAVSPGRNPRSRVQGVPARFNGGDGVLRGFRGRNPGKLA